MRADSAAGLAAVIGAGGLAVIPTDTVYGICCDADSQTAVERLELLKGRPAGKPAAVAFFSIEAALEALPELGERTRIAARVLLPGALTLLVSNPAARFPLAGGELLGLRVIDLSLAPGRAVLLTSANLAGGRDPRTVGEVPAVLLRAAGLAIDHGTLPLAQSLPSVP